MGFIAYLVVGGLDQRNYELKQKKLLASKNLDPNSLH
jgi:hypothetical protein